MTKKLETFQYLLLLLQANRKQLKIVFQDRLLSQYVVGMPTTRFFGVILCLHQLLRFKQTGNTSNQ